MRRKPEVLNYYQNELNKVIVGGKAKLKRMDMHLRKKKKE